MTCWQGETSEAYGSCDAEDARKMEQLKKLNQQIAEGNYYDDPPSVMEALWEEREKIKRELHLN